MATALEQLRYIDEQLERTALSADKLEAVRAHRLTGVQLRQQKMAGKDKICAPCRVKLVSQTNHRLAAPGRGARPSRKAERRTVADFRRRVRKVALRDVAQSSWRATLL